MGKGLMKLPSQVPKKGRGCRSKTAPSFLTSIYFKAYPLQGTP
ncbi:hypothetical protein DSOL_4158 [Desulfosporosinus metallidurans]|uniref:Uncharacterized protein n=1 Tax=Desulfosporosinus metallidurans TaxID=1888891 RepID=A0A1Q8QLQ1_9FIRM|nr:hypothetical protein DSOL_4158 [Desulfosporosinus metallidurans]